MSRDDPRYQVRLVREDGSGVASFPFDELPTCGLQFEVKDERWRVAAVTLAVRSEDEPPNAVECDVILAARWDSPAERWDTTI